MRYKTVTQYTVNSTVEDLANVMTQGSPPSPVETVENDDGARKELIFSCE